MAIDAAATSEPTDQHPAEAGDPEDQRGDELHADGADRRDEGDHARLERRQPEADLEHQRQQERHGADADAKQRAAEHRGAEHLVAEQFERQQRIFGAARMQQIERARQPARPPR